MKSGSQKRLFVHIFLWVLVAVCIGSASSLWLTWVVYDRDETLSQREYVVYMHRVISAELLDVPRDQWRPILNKWEHITEYGLDVAAIDAPIWEKEGLAKPVGNRLAFNFHSTFFTDYLEASRRIPGTRQVLIFSMDATDTSSFQAAYYVGEFISLLLIAIVSFLLVNPVFRASQRLSSTAQRYAQGELDLRVETEESDPFEEVALQFNRMAEQIQHKIHEQEVMTHAISHELKTPITRLRLALDMAASTQDTAELREFLIEMDHDVSELDALTSQLLSLARLTYAQDSIPLERLMIGDIIQEEANKLQSFNDSVKITFTGNTAAYCFGHRDHLSRIFHNLLTNGQRYANSAINIDLSLNDEMLLVTVDDDGPGIPEDQREQIFLAFARLDSSRTRKTGGYGLGLAIVRQSVEKQRGSIVADSSPMGGARFTLQFHKA
jgi:signal transduction histidine kinase